MKVLILSSRARTIFKYSCSLTKTVVIFKSQIKERYDSPSPDLESRAISSQIQALSGSLVAKSSRSSGRCLLHWRLLAALSIGSSAVCTLRTVLHSSGGAVDRAGYSSALRQTRAQTNQYCNPNPGSPLWVLALGTRSSLSCGRWFLPHWRCPQSALGPVVSLAPADRCLNPSFLLGAVLPSQALLLH